MNLEQIREWLLAHPIIFGLGTMLMGILLGALTSWLITVRYYRKSSRETPQWVREELLPLLPQNQPTPEELAALIFEALPKQPKHNVAETCSNSDGHWFRYHNGDQTCTGSFAVPAHETTIDVPFPQEFIGDPAVELSGEVGCIAAKHATRRKLTVKLNRPNTRPLEFTYQARGHWISPHEVDSTQLP